MDERFTDFEICLFTISRSAQLGSISRYIAIKNVTFTSCNVPVFMAHINELLVLLRKPSRYLHTYLLVLYFVDVFRSLFYKIP